MSSWWNLWLPIAFVAPVIWAVECLVDLYFVHDIYRDEWDATVISGVFMLIPWLIPVFGILPFNPLPTHVMYLAFLGGALFLGSYLFYFRSLFRFADSPLILMLWETQILAVPFLTWLWFDEQLLPMHYVGIGLAFVGSLLFGAREGLLRDGLLRVAGTMVWAVLLFAASMVLQKEAYRNADGRFFDVYLMFSLGGAVLSVIIVLVRPKTTMERVRRLGQFNSTILTLLVLSEIVSCGVIVFSQRAIALAPSASFVSAIESSVPAFIMLFSLLLAHALRRTRHEKITALFRQQMIGWQEKLLAMLLMSVGIYCIAG
ncbi:MAG: hypothetical protein IPO13_01035 [Rhodocyclaceae bacterium]|nr:hypothetical protein [Rhodocyclaceae bacterium]